MLDGLSMENVHVSWIFQGSFRWEFLRRGHGAELTVWCAADLFGSEKTEKGGRLLIDIFINKNQLFT